MNNITWYMYTCALQSPFRMLTNQLNKLYAACEKISKIKNLSRTCILFIRAARRLRKKTKFLPFNWTGCFYFPFGVRFIPQQTVSKRDCYSTQSNSTGLRPSQDRQESTRPCYAPRIDCVHMRHLHTCDSSLIVKQVRHLPRELKLPHQTRNSLKYNYNINKNSLITRLSASSAWDYGSICIYSSSKKHSRSATQDSSPDNKKRPGQDIFPASALSNCYRTIGMICYICFFTVIEETPRNRTSNN